MKGLIKVISKILFFLVLTIIFIGGFIALFTYVLVDGFIQWACIERASKVVSSSSLAVWAKYVGDMLLGSLVYSIPAFLRCLFEVWEHIIKGWRTFWIAFRYAVKYGLFAHAFQSLKFIILGLGIGFLVNAGVWWVIIPVIVSIIWRMVASKKQMGMWLSRVSENMNRISKEHEIAAFNNFMDIAIRDYGLNPVVKTLNHQKPISVDVVKNNRERYFGFSFKTFRFFFKKEIVKKWVLNENRSYAIQEIISQIIPNTTISNLSTLLADHSSILNSYIGEEISFPQCRISYINERFAAVRMDMETIFKVRLEQYVLDYENSKAGADGEAALEKTLSTHRNLTSLFNLRFEDVFEDKKRSCEIDAICINEYGIFVIEAKNYGRNATFRIEIEADGAWYKVKNRYSKREQMDNPYAQNDWHVAVLEDLAYEILGRRIAVHNIIVLANDTVDVKCAPGANQVLGRVGTVYNQISQYSIPVLNNDEIEKLKEGLLNRSLPPKKYPLIDYEPELVAMVESYKQLYDFAVQTNDAIEKCYADHPF